jgi:two-component system KDP operon response regulator KdpE
MNQKPLILCVDDDPDIRHFLRTVLEEEGYEVVDAPSAEEGLRLYRQRQPAAVIVDLMMEEVDAGTNFVRELRTIGVKVPVFLLSSVGDQLNAIADYGTLGLSGILQKPISPSSLVSTLRTRLARPTTNG